MSDLQPGRGFRPLPQVTVVGGGLWRRKTPVVHAGWQTPRFVCCNPAGDYLWKANQLLLTLRELCIVAPGIWTANGIVSAKIRLFRVKGN